MIYYLTTVYNNVHIVCCNSSVNKTYPKYILKIDLIDSGMTNLLYTILKHKFKAPETEVGIRN